LALHEALRRVKWAEDAAQALAAPGLDPEAVAEARACLRDPGLAEFFANPGPNTTVWRERAFDLVLHGVLHSGVFDRVIVHRDAAGSPEAAVLIDFKTEFPTPTASEAAEQHRPQLEIYRQALCRLLRLPPEKIRSVVVFTGTRQALEI
jgi:ATP-dependent helicase/nuclease subunit A